MLPVVRGSFCGPKAQPVAARGNAPGLGDAPRGHKPQRGALRAPRWGLARRRGHRFQGLRPWLLQIAALRLQYNDANTCIMLASEGFFGWLLVIGAQLLVTTKTSH